MLGCGAHLDHASNGVEGLLGNAIIRTTSILSVNKGGEIVIYVL